MVIDAAERRGVDHVVFNQRAAPHSDLWLGVDKDGLRGELTSTRRVDLELVRGVYVRLMDHSKLPEAELTRRGTEDFAGKAKSAWLHRMLIEWLELTRGRVMNRASSMASNMSKAYQAQLIRKVGFSVPETLITNDPDEVRRFKAAHGRVIYKSISSVRSIVRELEDAKTPGLERIRYLPTQFQAFIDGPNIRVHVVGEQVFATLIDSDAVDYRYASRDGLETSMCETELPPEVSDRCVTLSKVLELPLCGIDLKRTPSGEFVCFEVNPSPAFSYYQGHTGQPIADAIVSYLIG